MIRYSVASITVLLTLTATELIAQIYRVGDGEVIPGTENIQLGSRVDLSNLDLTDGYLAYKTLFGADFSGTNLTRATLLGSWLFDAIFDDAIIRGTELRDAKGLTSSQIYSTASYRDGDLSGVNFQRQDLTGWNFRNIDLTNAVFFQSTLNNADFEGSIINGTDLSASVERGFTRQALESTLSAVQRDLRGVKLNANDLSAWNFQQFDMTGARFAGADLAGANLIDAVILGADFARANGLTEQMLRSTVSYRNRNLDEIVMDELPVSGWDFSGQSLSRAAFRNAVLDNATFDDAVLTGAIFSGASLQGTSFRRSSISGANFDGTTTRGLTMQQLSQSADFQNKQLMNISFGLNDLRDWDFTGIRLNGTSFRGSKLANVRFDDAEIADVSFYSTVEGGFVKEQLYATASYARGELSGIDWSFNDLADWNFSLTDLSLGTFLRSNLDRAQFTNANLSGVRFAWTSLHDADFQGAVIRGAEFANVTDIGFTAEMLYSTSSYQAGDLTDLAFLSVSFNGWRFDHKDLRRTTFNNVDVSKADFQYADLSGANLGNSSFFHANLRNANLSGAVLSTAGFFQATLEGAIFDDARISAANLNNVTAFGFTESQLRATWEVRHGVPLRIYLENNDLSGWDLRSFLRVSSYSGSRLANANLHGADLHGCNLVSIDGTSADFSNANLSRAILNAADFSHADLRGANFYQTTLNSNTNFSNADLRGAYQQANNGSPQEIAIAVGILRNTIEPNGTLRALTLADNEYLKIRNVEDGTSADLYPTSGNIRVETEWTMSPHATLVLVFDSADWRSTISFEPSADIALNGTLDLQFAPDVDTASLVGKRFVLFDWTNVTSDGNFQTIQSDAIWDVSELYSTGSIRLLMVPEPHGLTVIIFAGLVAIRWENPRRGSGSRAGT